MSIGHNEDMRIGVSGAAGRMGRTVCAAVAADPDLVLAAVVDPFGIGELIEGVPVSADLEAFSESSCDVVVDFTVAVAARRTLPWRALPRRGPAARLAWSGARPIRFRSN